MKLLPVLLFCNDLEAAVRTAAPNELAGLREAGAVYRADTCFESMADLSDRIVECERGLVDETAVRFEALRVCRLAVLLWLSVVSTEDDRP